MLTFSLQKGLLSLRVGVGGLVLLPLFSEPCKVSPAKLPSGELVFLTLSPADFVVSSACLSTLAHGSSQHGEASVVGTRECEGRL